MENLIKDLPLKLDGDPREVSAWLDSMTEDDIRRLYPSKNKNT